MINITTANLYYGDANSGLKDYKESVDALQAGASFQTGITGHFSLVTELYFMKKGGKLKADNPLTGSASSLRFNTLEIPVLARVHLGKFYMNAGPSIAYTLSGKQKVDGSSTKLSFSNGVKGIKRWDAGLQAGGGVAFPIKDKCLAIDLRYNHGLTNIGYGRELYNRGFIVSVHFSKAWKTNPLAKTRS